VITALDLRTILEIIPVVALAVVSVLTVKDLPRWKWIAVVGFTLVAAGATGWDLLQKEQGQAHSREVRDKLAQFESAGQTLLQRTYSDAEPPTGDFARWASDTEAYLSAELGPSYVTRFRSAAGLPMSGVPIGIQITRLELWSSINSRVARLEQFTTELPSAK
jgi:hypothetical protein